MRDAGRKAKPGPQSDSGCPALLATRGRLIETCSPKSKCATPGACGRLGATLQRKGLDRTTVQAFLVPTSDYDNAPRRQLRFDALLRYPDASLKAF